MSRVIFLNVLVVSVMASQLAAKPLPNRKPVHVQDVQRVAANLDSMCTAIGWQCIQKQDYRLVFEIKSTTGQSIASGIVGLLESGIGGIRHDSRNLAVFASVQPPARQRSRPSTSTRVSRSLGQRETGQDVAHRELYMLVGVAVAVDPSKAVRVALEYELQKAKVVLVQGPAHKKKNVKRIQEIQSRIAAIDSLNSTQVHLTSSITSFDSLNAARADSAWIATQDSLEAAPADSSSPR